MSNHSSTGSWLIQPSLICLQIRSERDDSHETEGWVGTGGQREKGGGANEEERGDEIKTSLGQKERCDWGQNNSSQSRQQTGNWCSSSHFACTSVTYRPPLSPLRTITDGVFGQIWLQAGRVGPELDSVESCVLFENKLGGEEWDRAVQPGIAAKAQSLQREQQHTRGTTMLLVFCLLMLGSQ